MTTSEYIALLQSHDWSYEFSDDHSAWRKGKAERDRLHLMRSKLDPSNALWNIYAPIDHRMT